MNESGHWNEITPSPHPHEREALSYLRENLPDHDPYRAWTNFEFVASDGNLYEVDALIVSPKGFFLVEIKSWPGELTGDAGTWKHVHEGRTHYDDNPLILANRKAKKLKSLLERQPAAKRTRLPFLAPVVFLSNEQLACKLTPEGRLGVYLRDDPDRDPDPRGIIAALKHVPPEQWQDPSFRRVDKKMSRTIAAALETAGIRRSRRARRVGDWEVEQLLAEGSGYQDWLARHTALDKSLSRVRVYTIAEAADEETRNTIRRAAKREYQILEGVEHPAILRARGYTESELGPAVIFDYDGRAVRLDHYLDERRDDLSTESRLGILRSLAEALRYAHSKQLMHRALSPHSVLVCPTDGPVPRVQVFNWQTGARLSEMTTDGATYTAHLDCLIEPAAAVYLAPETRFVGTDDAELLDVFSLGTIAFHLFAGRAPAATVPELTRALRDDGGLQLAAAIDGVPEDLDCLVQLATHPDVTVRLTSAAEFLDMLDMVEDALTRPDTELADPTRAKKGDVLPGGFRVVRRLGTGSTAVVYEVDIEGQTEPRVLKLALDADRSSRLVDEAEVLDLLEHQNIVRLLGPAVDICERKALLLESAGEETLRQRLREEGRLSLEFLERFGQDLLEALAYLERAGVAHRDIKPDNLGIRETRGDRTKRLVLFDFSLSRAPSEHITAGTQAYLDPFLSLRGRWDLQAERFSVGVTLHEMATGTLPRWGDGQSDPAATGTEPSIDSDLFDAAVREPLTEFFATALAPLDRDEAGRFDNAADMLRAWQGVFATIHEPAPPTDVTTDEDREALLADATLETPVYLLGLGTRATNALERLGIDTVRDLLARPAGPLASMRGVGNRTRREIGDTVKVLRRRFTDVSLELAAPEEELAGSSIDVLVRQLLPGGKQRAQVTKRDVLERYLAITPLTETDVLWPSQTDVAAEVGVTRARVSQLVAEAAERWSKSKPLSALRTDIDSLLNGEGGIMTAAELADALLAARGCSAQGEERRRLAHAVAHAAVDGETARSEPGWVVRRRGDNVFVARVADGGHDLVVYAQRLGERADRLAVENPLPSARRILDELQATPTGSLDVHLPGDRLVRLAAAASTHAAATARGELYPRGLGADRALRLSFAALLGARELTEDELRDRVKARYPEAEELPRRPELDRLLEDTELGFTWDSTAHDGAGAFVTQRREPTGLTSIGSTSLTRRSTVSGPLEEITPEIAEALDFEDRLRRSLAEGGFLALGTPPRTLVAAEREVTSRFPVTVMSLEALLLDAMHDVAAARNVRWDVVVRADAEGPASPDWRHLLDLVRLAIPAVEAHFVDSEVTILLTQLGMLTRYDQLGLLDRLHERAGRAPGPDGMALFGLWALVPVDYDAVGPVMDGHTISIVTPGEWAPVPVAWVENVHRSARSARGPA